MSPGGSTQPIDILIVGSGRTNALVALRLAAQIGLCGLDLFTQVRFVIINYS